MTTISSQTIVELYYANVVFELHQTTNKLSLFKKKYKTDFEGFEKKVKGYKKENFEKWDDYIEWKGLNKYYRELLTKKKDLASGNIKIT